MTLIKYRCRECGALLDIDPFEVEIYCMFCFARYDTKKELERVGIKVDKKESIKKSNK